MADINTRRWEYNCEDCCRTFEAEISLQAEVDAAGLRIPADFQISMFIPILKAMILGVAIDAEKQKKLSKELKASAKEHMEWIAFVVGYELNPKSPKQMAKFFYEEMALPKQYSKKPSTKGYKSVTCSSEALATLAVKEPMLLPLVTMIEEYRTLGVFVSNFLSDKRDDDGRIRCSYNIGGTATFRLSSRENAFGSGLNLQNIPANKKDD